MTKQDFPEEVTKKNIASLTETAERIRKSYVRLEYSFGVVIPYIAVGILSLYGIVNLGVWLGVNHYLDFILWFSLKLQPIIFFLLLIIFVTLFSFFVLVPLLLLMFWLLRKYSDYPTHEEIIFAEAFIIANHLTNDERRKAKGEVLLFLAILTTFVRDWFNTKRKDYAPEFNLLRSGKNAICRMLMFSQDEIPQLFMNFGLAFVKDDHPKAFSHLKQIVEEARKYGGLKGRVHRFLSAIEQYPHAIPWILTIVTIVAAIVYYFISGQRLPIG